MLDEHSIEQDTQSVFTELMKWEDQTKNKINRKISYIKKGNKIGVAEKTGKSEHRFSKKTFELRQESREGMSHGTESREGLTGKRGEPGQEEPRGRYRHPWCVAGPGSWEVLQEGWAGSEEGHRADEPCHA